MKSRTQRYIDKYCEYIDRFLVFWKKETDCFQVVWEIAAKADFLSAMLRLDTYHNLRNMRWDDIPFQKKREKEEYEKWKEYQKRPPEQRLMKQPTRVEILKELKQKAKAIKQPLQHIESKTRPKNQITKEKLEELLSSLDYLQKVLRTNRLSIEAPIHGEIANQLVVEMGLVSKNRLLAIKHSISDYKKMPYDPAVWQDNISVAAGYGYPEKTKETIDLWIKWTKGLLKKCKPQESKILDRDAIPIEYQTPSISLKFMASCIGGKMNARKLKGLMDNGHYKYIKVKHQNFVFDLRQFPPSVKEKLAK